MPVLEKNLLSNQRRSRESHPAKENRVSWKKKSNGFESIESLKSQIGFDPHIKKMERIWGDCLQEKRTLKVSASHHSLKTTKQYKETELERDFKIFAKNWRRETAKFSSIIAKSMNQNYQKIISLGKEAIPLILNELHKRPDHWFWALNVITNDINPVQEEDEGDIEKMSEAWVKWGQENHYI